MRYSLFTALLAVLFLAPFAEIAAQYRPDYGYTLNRSGNILRPLAPPETSSSRFGIQDFSMSHSYQITMGSFGGTMFNQNMYTNTMNFMINDNLHARVDLSMAHSPLGPNIMGQNNHAQFFVQNAEINYRFSDRTFLQVRFQQFPQGAAYGYSPYGYAPRHQSPFMRERHNSPFNRW